MPSSDASCVGKQSVGLFNELRTPGDWMSATSSDSGSSEHQDKPSESVWEHGEDTSNEADVNIVDPNCVAENPYRVTFQDITSAAFLIKSGIECTPCTVSVASRSA